MKRNFFKKVCFLNRSSFRRPVFPFLKYSFFFFYFLCALFLLFLISGSGKEDFFSQKIEKISKVSHCFQKQPEKVENDIFLSSFSGAFLGDNNTQGKAFFANKDSIILADSPLSNQSQKVSPLFTYRVKKGDTLFRIARRFNISLSTILSVNHLKINSVIRPGMELVILPVTGILYQVQDKETLESISKKFKIPLKDLKKFNNLKDEKELTGKTIVIPGIIQRVEMMKRNKKNHKKLPFLKGYFSPPCRGWSSGSVDENNGLEISNLCGTFIYVSQEGLVIESKNGWNKGLGNFVEIQHPNGTRTIYGFLRKIFLKKGDYVKKGEKIGEMGGSGRISQSKSCRLYFAVEGARNFLAK